MASGAGTAPWRGLIVASNPRTIATFSPYSESDDSEDEGEGQAQQVQHVKAGRLPPTKPLYRTNKQDIAPATVICVARFSRPACLFPPKTAQVPVPTKTIHVYPILIENGFKIFAQQRSNANVGKISVQRALFALEAASYNVSPLHVLRVIRVSRYWTGATWQTGANAKLKSGFMANSQSQGCPDREALLVEAMQSLPAHVGLRF